jgi:hypothetical protein
LTRAAIRQAEATGNFAPIREAVASAHLAMPELAQPAPSLTGRLTGAAKAWGGIVMAAVGMIALTVVLVLVGSGAIDGDSEPAPTSPPPAATATGEGTQPAPRPGEAGATTWSKGRAFDNGDYRLTVLDIRTGLTQIGGSGTWTSEQGQFVEIGVEVEYTGAGSGYFPLDQQRLRVTSGAEYTNDIESAFRAQTNALGQEPITSGSSQSGSLVFDIKTTDSPAAIEFVGDFLEPPVSIPLG